MAPPRIRLCRDLGSASAAVSRSRDVIFEILSWLPAKSMCRCRCVSREWRALISDPAFVAAHKSRAEPLLIGMSSSVHGPTLQLMDTDGTVVQRFPLKEGDWTLSASLGDLACISSNRDRSDTLLVDLFTGKVQVPCLKPAEDIVPAGILMYSSCGRAMPSGALKVVRLVLPVHADTKLICKVLTLGDGSAWRQTQSPPKRVSHWYNSRSSSGVRANGAFNFLSEDLYDVLSFDLDKEKWKLIHGPPSGFIGRKKAVSIADLNGTLCMARMVQPLEASIWLLSDSDKSFWTKAYSLPVGPFVDFVVPLTVLRLGGELLFYLYDHRKKPVLQVYDPRSGKCTDVKTSASLIGRIGLCSSNLDPRFRGQSQLNHLSVFLK